MEVKERLRRIIQGFNQELNEKLRPVFIDSYQCEMECYEKLTVLDDADECAKNCKEFTNSLRNDIQTKYGNAFVNSK